MVTLKEIAKEAGVSIMTVSRVINKRYSQVSDENIQKIESIIKRLGYVPNSSARSLSSRCSRIISVIIHGTDNPLITPYNSTMLGYIVQEIQERGYNTMVHFTNEYSDVTKHLHSWKAEGAIFLGIFEQDVEQIQRDNDIPLIFTDSYSHVRQINNVGLDDYKGGVLAARHLIEHGHTCMAYASYHLSPQSEASHVMLERLKGFQDTIRSCGLTFTQKQIFNIQTVGQTAKELTESNLPITAVFAGSDLVALDLMKELYLLGKSVPQDYSLIGFDNLPYSNHSIPGLTTISQDIHQKALCSVDMLFQHLEDPSVPAQNTILDVELLDRQSVRTL